MSGALAKAPARIALALLVGGGALAAAPDPGGSAGADLIAGHLMGIRASGPTAQAIRGTAVLAEQNISGPFQLIRHGSEQVQLTIELPGGLRWEQGLDGDLAWARDPSPRLLSEGEGKLLQALAALHASTDLTDKLEDIESRGRAIFHEHTTTMLQARIIDGPPISLFFDSFSGMCVGARIAQQIATGASEIRFEDYQRSGTLYLPQRIIHTSDTLDIELRVEQVAFVDVPRPTPPADIVESLWDASGPRVTELPYTWWEGYPVVEAQMASGQTLRLAIDPSTGPNLVSPLGAQRLELASDGVRTRIIGPGGEPMHARARALPSFSLGSRTYSGLTGAVADIRGLDPDAQHIDGVLGLSFLSLHLVEIDPHSRKVRIYPQGVLEAGRGPPVAAAGRVGLEPLAAGLWQLEGRFGNHDFPLRLTFGPGASYVNWPAANLAGVVPGGLGVEESKPIVESTGREITSYTKLFSHLRIGDLVISPAPLSIANLNEIQEATGVGPGGLLESELLRGYWLVLDMGNQTLYAARRRPG